MSSQSNDLAMLALAGGMMKKKKGKKSKGGMIPLAPIAAALLMPLVKKVGELATDKLLSTQFVKNARKKLGVGYKLPGRAVTKKPKTKRTQAFKPVF